MISPPWLMNKTTIFCLIMILFLGRATYAEDDDGCASPSLDAILSQSDAAITDVTVKIANEVIQEPKAGIFEGCILDLGSFGAGFSFGLPSLGDILGDICSDLMGDLTSYVDDHVDSLMSGGSFSIGALDVSYDTGFNLGDDLFFGSPPIEIGATPPEVIDAIKTAIDAASVD